MTYMPPMDAMFLAMESREHPMHVGGLALFDKADGADDFARTLYEDMVRGDGTVASVFRRRPGRSLGAFSLLRWDLDDDVELDFHVRLLSLPAPGRVRELLELVSMLHGALLDRHRPLWEVYVIEGLADGRVAMYAKTHHALMDGVAAVRTWQRTLASDPVARDCRPPWRAERQRRQQKSTGLSDLTGAVRSISRTVGSVPEAISGTLELTRRTPGPLPYRAPHTMFNVPISGGRRFAAQSWPLARLRAVTATTGVTLNDLVLAMCAGALRRYLLAEDVLPERPLIAMVPVSLRGTETGPADGGNAVGAALCDLGTDEPDPHARLARIRESMVRTKSTMSRLTPLQVLGLSAVNVAGLALPSLPWRHDNGRPPFNIVISNVPGDEKPKYWNGVRLGAFYPASIPLDGQAVNITTISSGGGMHFGIVGCRRAVPHLQRLLLGLEESLAELEQLD
ncbi:WS/DGAT/MGAT family O-acyltransferase [Nocardia mangyaensis]|uniref:WS/DGAT/MGAT family O-acyltransferase n=1 Tax=Nocardia mangyaensis TaxID=2213200 RepID=UPI0026744528|nr:wax ester/triacylglycerol synthase family O-acyltransferase [Nocardia mangyaensis]MDO3648591.1 wax ester/triacylglycerol synthase family O-acyltransferase [Nocardia mangyaensis]